MNSFEAHLNELLVHTYRSIELMEQQMLENNRGLNLTISEFHLLEAVGMPEECPQGKTISELSEQMGISLPSVTLAINKLVKKGFVEKHKNERDGRLVHVRLTRDGVKANRLHQYFHRKMISSITIDLTEEEKEAMVRGIQKLNQYLNGNLQKDREDL